MGCYTIPTRTSQINPSFMEFGTSYYSFPPRLVLRSDFHLCLDYPPDYKLHSNMIKESRHSPHVSQLIPFRINVILCSLSLVRLSTQDSVLVYIDLCPRLPTILKLPRNHLLIINRKHTCKHHNTLP